MSEPILGGKAHRPVMRRRVTTIVAAAVVFVGVATGVGLTALGAPEQGTRPVSTPSASPTPANVHKADDSDEFDWWTIDPVADEVQFRGSREAHGGEYSLGISSALTQDSVLNSQVRQTVDITVGQSYAVSFWAKSSGGGEGAVEVQLGPWAARETIVIPGGTYDWTLFSTTYVAPQATAQLTVRIVVQGPTDGTWIDSFEVAGAGGALSNGDFESNSGELAITNATLLLPKKEPTLHISTRRAAGGAIQWQVVDVVGNPVLDGEDVIAKFTSSIDLTGLEPGFYSITLNATLDSKEIPRSTTFAVVAPLPEDFSLKKSVVGTHLHFKGGKERVTNLIGMLADVGVAHVRSDVSWSSTEVEPGVYEYADDIESAMSEYSRLGMSALRLPVYRNVLYDKGRTPSSPEGLQAYANFAADSVSHFTGVGKDIEVYNEFDWTENNGKCGKTPQCYIDMLSVTAKTVKAADPDAVIVAPGNAGMGFQFDWLRTFFELGGLQHTDAVSAHPYVQPGAPEQLGEGIDTLARMISDANGGVPKPIWLTEVGWPTVDGFVARDAQAEYLVRTMAVALGHGVERVYWYEAANSSLHVSDGEANFGMFEAATSLLPNTFAPKRAAVAQAVFAREVGNEAFTRSEDVGAAYSFVFGERRESVRILWTAGDPALVNVEAKGSVTVTDIFGAERVVKPQQGIVQLSATRSPVYVTGDISGVSAG